MIRFLAPLLALLVACGAGGSAMSATTVELDVYSGRPNPSWTLSRDDAARFERTVGALPPAPPGVWANPLGYRGFVVTGPDGSVVRVHAGAVQISEGGSLTDRADPDQALERWLLSTGGAAIDPPARDAARRALGPWGADRRACQVAASPLPQG